MEHVGIYPAYRGPLAIDPAPSVVKESAGAGFVAACPNGVSRDVQNPMLVTEIVHRRRLDHMRVHSPDLIGFFRKEKDVSVKLAPTATAALIAGKANISDDGYQFLEGKHFESSLFFLERHDAVVE
jgi:hypothetical protein